jgi:DNA-binding response OmpR family regulator
MAKDRVLIVEDEGNMRTMLALELESAGYQVFQAEDGEAAFQIAKCVKPDLIISDILMPQMDGNQLMKKLRDSEFGKHIPFIVMTARGQMQDYFEMLEVDDFIAKPFDAEDLLTRVGRVLEKVKKKKQATAGDGKETMSSGKKKVLILDDDAAVYDKFEKILTANGYEVNVVKTVPECLDSAVLFKPNMVVLRFLLEGMNGDKLVGLMKGMPHIKDVPLVVYSQKVRGWEEQSVLKAGAACFIGEITDQKLLEMVRRVIG